jgi:hypothetical protein
VLRKVLLILGVLVLAVIAVAFWLDIPRFVVGILTYGQQAREGTLQVGDAAPAVTVHDLDGVTAHALGDWIGERPLVLIFGSFT